MSGEMFDGQIALVTGGSRGIGKAIVNELISKKAEVIIVAKRDFSFDGARYIQTDLNDNLQVRELENILSDINIDVLINNAGINYVSATPTFPQDKFTEILNVNLITPFRLIKAVLPNMIKQEYGRVVNIASISAIICMDIGRSAYSASKSGLLGLTRAIAIEVANKNILINSILPGIVDTELTHNILKDDEDLFKKKIPIGRFATPEEIAKVVIFLSSKENTYITGEALVVDGGYSIQ